MLPLAQYCKVADSTAKACELKVLTLSKIELHAHVAPLDQLQANNAGLVDHELFVAKSVLLEEPETGVD